MKTSVFPFYVIALVVFFSSLCLAQDSSLKEEADAIEAVKKTPGLKADEPVILTVFNRPIAIFRSSIYGFGPAARVKIAQERIHEQIGKGKFEKISSTAFPEGTMIMMDDVLVFSILHGDVGIPFETMDQVVARTKAQLENTLEKIREQRSWKHNLKGAALTLLGLVVFLAVLATLFRGYAKAKVKVGEFEVGFLEKIRRHALMPIGFRFYIFTLLLRLVFWAIVGACIYSFLTFAFLQFPYSEPWGQKLGFYITDMISNLMLKAVDSIPNLFVIMIILIIVHWLVQIFRSFFYEVEKGKAEVSWLEPEAARPTSKIVTSILWIFAIVMAYPYIPGSSSEAFKGIGVFVGLLISLGASGMVGQVIGGMVLMYSKSIKIGEIVQIGESFGKVMEIGFFSTKLVTPKNEVINIPNAVLMGAVTKNFSRLLKAEGVILHTAVTIGYDAPWRQVQELLLRAADKTAGLAKNPAPFVFQKSLSDFYVEYELNAYLEAADGRMKVLSDLHANIQDQFNEFGVQIMSPNFEDQPENKVWVPKEKWFEPPAVKGKGE